MKVITGLARGKNLIAPMGEHTRPTLSRIKEAIFSAIQFDIADKVVLDLFAGSGQMGIEALSRLAKSAVFVDNDKAAIVAISRNLQETGLISKSKIENSECFSYVRHQRGTKKFDIVFVDAPYGKGLTDSMLKNIANTDVCTDDAFVICECEKSEKLSESYGNFTIFKDKTYAKTRIVIYKNSSQKGE